MRVRVRVCHSGDVCAVVSFLLLLLLLRMPLLLVCRHGRGICEECMEPVWVNQCGEHTAKGGTAIASTPATITTTITTTIDPSNPSRLIGVVMSVAVVVDLV